MKAPTSPVLRLLVLLLLLLSGLGSALSQNGQPCGNDCKKQTTSKCPTCPPAQSTHTYDAYTGNANRTITDLELWGAVSESPFRWQRFHNTRFTGGAQFLGTAGNWRHSFQWEMVSSGSNTSNQAQISVYEPEGGVTLFTQITSTQWNPPTSVSDILYQNGNSFTLQRGDGSRVNFTQLSDGSFQLVNITDSQSYVTTFTYDSSNLLSRVTEPAGRYFQITYGTVPVTNVNFTQLAKVTAVPTSGTWTEITIPNAQSFRYVRYRGDDTTRSIVSEIEFYDAAGNKLTGTPFGVGSSGGSYGYGNPFDGKTSTYYSGPLAGGYAGLDLGANAPAVAKIRYYPASSYTSRMVNGVFEGANAAPQTVPVITQVTTSDGRSVSYAYQPITDPTLPDLFQGLVSATYGDGTQAAYTYGQVFSSTRPVMMTADDPRYEGILSQVKYKYFNGVMDAVGEVQQEINLTTGVVLSTLSTTYSQHTPAITYSNGATMNFTMSSGLLTSQVDPLGNKTSFTYFSSTGFLATQTDARGYKTSYTTDSLGRRLTQTNPDGSVEKWTYDSIGLLLTHTDELGRVTTYTRDASRRVTRIDYPDASYETFSYNAIDPIAQTYGQLVNHRLRNGATESFTYDARGLRTSKTNSAGNVTTYTYDGNDRLASETDAGNNATAFLYTERGQQSRITYADGGSVSFTYDAYGNRTSRTNELGKAWVYGYDEFKRLVSVTDPLNRKTVYGYMLPGGVCACSSPSSPVTALWLPSGKQTAITYDLAWRKTSETVGAGTADAAATTYGYDSVGNLISVTDPRGKVWSYTYDNRNRRASASDPLNNKTQWTYDKAGNRLTETRANNGVTTNVYDAMNRLTQSTDPKGQVTKFTYDNADNLLSLTDARNNTYSFTYDALNRKARMIYPGGSHEDWSYDADGNLATYTTRAGQVKTSTFDVRNRESGYTWSANAAPAVTMSYDAAGRLLSMSSSVSSLNYSYDDANQLSSETSQIAADGAAKTVSYSYDADGNRTSVTYPSGSVVTYSYTGRNQVATITADAPPPIAAYSYDANGNRLTKGLENGTSAAYVYDDANRLLTVDNQAGGVSFDRLDYVYNAVNNRTSRRETVAGAAAVTDSYSYDAVDQVTGVSYGGTGRNVTYTYDPVGNRTSVNDSGTVTPYSTNTLNQYTAVDGISPGYDANGNLTSYGNWTYTYDAQNRLIQATGGPNNVNASFAYDPRNRCVRRTINNATTFYLYDGWNLIQEYTGGGDSETRRYVHGAQIDEPIALIDGSGTHFFHQDALGNAVRLTSSQGGTEETYTYDIYGAVTVKDAQGNVLAGGSAVGNRFLFTGREWIKEVSLYDYRNRVYSQEIGRFLQTDPMRLSRSKKHKVRLHITILYNIASNNPVLKTDPNGLWDMVPYPSPDGSPGPDYGAAVRCLGALGVGWWNLIKYDFSDRSVNDRYMHCLVSCRMTKTSGADCAELIGDLQESYSRDPNDSAGDQNANKAGRNAATQCPSKNCEDSCKEAGFNP